MFLDLTPEQQRIIALAKDRAQEFAQCAEQHDREGSFPFENIARLKETGYTTLTTPKECGVRVFRFPPHCPLGLALESGSPNLRAGLGPGTKGSRLERFATRGS